MENSEVFKLSTDELKKINSILPKGYKLITKDDLVKKGPQKFTKRKTQVLDQSISRIKNTKVKEEEYEPSINIKKYVQPKINLVENISVDLTNMNMVQKIYHRLKAYTATNLISHTHQFQKLELKIEDPNYSWKNLEAEIANICKEYYKTYSRTDEYYNTALAIESRLNDIIREEKATENKKNQNNISKVAPSNNDYNYYGANKRKIVPKVEPLPSNSNIPPTINQKRLLGQNIKKLPSESLQQICYMIFYTTENREYSFDLDTLHFKKFREVQQFVKKCMQKTGQFDQKNFQEDEFSNESSFVIDDTLDD